MTVLTDTNKRIATGDGSTVDFAFTFAFFANGDITVQLDGVLQTEITDYTLTNDDPGGTVTFGTAPGSDVQVLIKRILPITQGFDYIENDNFPAESHEEALDRMVMILQQGDEVLNRTLRLVETATTDAPELDDLTGQAGKTLRVNTAETGVEFADATSGGSLTLPLPIVDGGTQAATASAARTNLGVEIGVDVQAWDAQLDDLAARAIGDVATATDIPDRDAADTRWFRDVKVTVFTSTDTWTKDSEAKAVEVEVVGAGGGGGGCAATGAGEGATSGGGGAGGYSRKKFLASALAATETVTIGALGAGGTAGDNVGSTGGTSSFATGQAYAITATGGQGGSGSITSSGSPRNNGGAGGDGSGGDLNFPGASGGIGRVISSTPLGGGFGGASALSGGARGLATSSDGTDATGNGGGGAGANSSASQAARPGGDGAVGLVIVREYL